MRERARTQTSSAITSKLGQISKPFVDVLGFIVVVDTAAVVGFFSFCLIGMKMTTCFGRYQIN